MHDIELSALNVVLLAEELLAFNEAPVLLKAILRVPDVAVAILCDRVTLLDFSVAETFEKDRNLGPEWQSLFAGTQIDMG